MHNDTSFARLVSLACHDLRTPLATVHGFARTLTRTATLEAPADRYVDMIDQASSQLAELLDELALAARIEAGRYDPTLRAVDTMELAQSAAEQLGEDRVSVSGDGESVDVDVEPVQRGVSALVQATLRHGGLESVDVRVRGREIDVAPVTASASQVVTGADLRDLGSAVAVLLLDTLGGGVSVDGETLTVRLPG